MKYHFAFKQRGIEIPTTYLTKFHKVKVKLQILIAELFISLREMYLNTVDSR